MTISIKPRSSGLGLMLIVIGLMLIVIGLCPIYCATTECRGLRRIYCGLRGVVNKAPNIPANRYRC